MAFEAARSVLPGFGLTLGYHAALPEPDRADPAGGAVRSRRPTLTWDAVLAHGRPTRGRWRPIELTFGASFVAALRSTPCSACWSPGCWCATASPAAGSSTRWSTCRSPCRPRSPASRSTAHLLAERLDRAATSSRWASRSPSRRSGIIVALTFIGLPFVVRTVQPVLEDLDAEVEEAAASLGASRWQTFTRVILPDRAAGAADRLRAGLRPRLGEYGSVVFISGNMPMKTEIAPLLIVTKLEQYDYAGATAIARGDAGGCRSCCCSAINLLQWWSRGAACAVVTHEPRIAVRRVCHESDAQRGQPAPPASPRWCAGR